MKAQIKLVILLVWLSIANASFAQEPVVDSNKRFVVYGKCLIKNGNYSGQSMVLTKDSIEVVRISKRKKFRFELDFNSNYTITMSKPGYIPIQIEFSTEHIPVSRWNEGFVPFEFGVTLVQQPTDSVSSFNQPIAKVFFQEDSEDFHYSTNISKTTLPR